MADQDLPDPIIIAKVQLSELAPEDGKDLRAQVNKKKVQRLVRIFELNGCRDAERPHRVNALVCLDELRNVLARSEQIHTQLPRLRFGHPITFLRGRHRLAAAAEFLPVRDQWWTVQLYDDKITNGQRRRLREDYVNAGPPCDGELFCCLAEVKGCRRAEDEYFAKWDSESKTELFRQLQTRREFEDIQTRLYCLLPFKGQWPDLQFGTARRWLSLWFPEEFCTLLQRTHDVWSDILGTERPEDLDALTVRSLQGRSPLYSNEDRCFIAQLMVSGQLFPDIPDLPRRRQLLGRVLRAHGIIPSLNTNIEDSKFLEPLFLRVRPLFEPRTKGRKKESTKEAAERCYRAPQGSQILLERTDGQITAVTIPGVDQIPDFGFWTAYCQILLGAYRLFPHITDLKPRKDPKSTVHIQQKNKAHCQMQLAQLALKLGFQSSTIFDNANGRLQGIAATDILSNFESQDIFEGSFGNEAEQVKSFFPDVSFGNAPDDVPEMTINASEQWRLDHRCGRTFEQAFYRDRKFYFFEHFFAPKNICMRERLTSFAVARLTFHAFLGSIEQFNLTSHTLAALFSKPIAESAGDPPPNGLFGSISQQPNRVSSHSRQPHVYQGQPRTESVRVTSQQADFVDPAPRDQFLQADSQIRPVIHQYQTHCVSYNAESQQRLAPLTADTVCQNTEHLRDEQPTELLAQQDPGNEFPPPSTDFSHSQGLHELNASTAEDLDILMFGTDHQTPSSLFDDPADEFDDNGNEIIDATNHLGQTSELSRTGSMWRSQPPPQPPATPQRPPALQDSLPPPTIPQPSTLPSLPQPPALQPPTPPQLSTSPTPQSPTPPQPSTLPSLPEPPTLQPPTPQPPALQQPTQPQPPPSPSPSQSPTQPSNLQPPVPPQASTLPALPQPPASPLQEDLLGQQPTNTHRSRQHRHPPDGRQPSRAQQQPSQPQSGVPGSTAPASQDGLLERSEHQTETMVDQLTAPTQEGDAATGTPSPLLSFNRRRRRSLSPEGSESIVINDRRRESPTGSEIIVIDDRRRALLTPITKKYRIVETRPTGNVENAPDIDTVPVNTIQTDNQCTDPSETPRAGTRNEETSLWRIENASKAVQRLFSTSNINEGQFIRRFGQLRHIYQFSMPCCILDKETGEYIFITDTPTEQNLKTLILEYAQHHRCIWSVDFEQNRRVLLSWDKASQAYPAGQLFIMPKKTDHTISNGIDYGPEALSVLEMPLFDGTRWRVVDTEQVPNDFFDL